MTGMSAVECSTHRRKQRPVSSSRTVLGVIVFLLLICGCEGFFQEKWNAYKRRRRKRQVFNRLKSAPPDLVCRIFKETTIRSSEFGVWDEEQLLCSPLVHGVESDQAYKISVPANMKQKNMKDIEAGDFYVSVQGGRIEDDAVVGYSDNGVTVKHMTTPRSRQLQQVGKRSILVLRVTVRDSEPDFTADEFRERIFGYDGLTLQSQYNKCSAGKLLFEPASIGSGVLEVSLPDNVISDFASSAALSNAAQTAAAEFLNLPPDMHISALSDHVMICLPPGTGDWVAAAAMNHWRSVYNNKFCGMISASMHEIGHNLGLSHANENGEYLDGTSYMSAGHYRERYPEKCFNGQNHYHLGWFSDRTLQLENVDSPVVVKLASFVDYRLLSEGSDDVVVLISIDERYFLQFNQAKDYNIETEEKVNQITIVEDTGGGTELIAGIDMQSPRYIIKRYRGRSTLSITVCEAHIGERNSADMMIVSIGKDSSACPAPPTHPPTPGPTTGPTLAPTASPTEMPSSAPSRHPTFKPSANPSATPSLSPTEKPTPAASEVPTKFPTPEPSEAPTKFPSNAPSSMPTTSPTLNPTSVPTSRPTKHPTGLPSSIPTPAPSPEPSKFPTSSPTEMPTAAPTKEPTLPPTAEPSTKEPTRKPSSVPTGSPSISLSPSGLPSEPPSSSPTPAPSFIPSLIPSFSPTALPSSIPSIHPSGSPTTSFPSSVPSVSPSGRPTISFEPTETPSISSSPSKAPSNAPTTAPSSPPSDFPTITPTAEPTARPSSKPTSLPSEDPTALPTSRPTESPSASPSLVPTVTLSHNPSSLPSSDPTSFPTELPSSSPTESPTIFPSSPLTSTPSKNPSGVPTLSPSPTSLPSESLDPTLTAAPTDTATSVLLIKRPDTDYEGFFKAVQQVDATTNENVFVRDPRERQSSLLDLDAKRENIEIEGNTFDDGADIKSEGEIFRRRPSGMKTDEKVQHINVGNAEGGLDQDDITRSNIIVPNHTGNEGGKKEQNLFKRDAAGKPSYNRGRGATRRSPGS